MIFTMIQQAPAETANYMIAGYAVIFSVIAIYVASLVIRARNLKRDMQMLNDLGKEQQ